MGHSGIYIICMINNFNVFINQSSNIIILLYWITKKLHKYSKIVPLYEF